MNTEIFSQYEQKVFKSKELEKILLINKYEKIGDYHYIKDDITIKQQMLIIEGQDYYHNLLCITYKGDEKKVWINSDLSMIHYYEWIENNLKDLWKDLNWHFEIRINKEEAAKRDALTAKAFYTKVDKYLKGLGLIYKYTELGGFKGGCYMDLKDNAGFNLKTFTETQSITLFSEEDTVAVFWLFPEKEFFEVFPSDVNCLKVIEEKLKNRSHI